MKELSKISVFTGILILVSYCLMEVFKFSFVHPAIYQILGFLWFLYTSIHITHLLVAKNPNIESAILPLVGLGLRFLVSLFTVMIYLIKFPENSALFVLNFMAAYLIYVVFEITALLSNLRRNSSQDQNT
ncbi:hypothetical protein SAMN04488029_2525 [Reichenbachiella faecimaris]|uniref:ATP synthase I chain n=1 Tax=Reichenbachiella faecimaris TaxID=692418 RepID=A0A1W2GG05_REIFA|nr:hypothetical protein [Reichenbachiella faecimaris]SMD35444.1 hypothetical protein SAMN04488029_2525 [Reichenbachiella faecimaris]